MNFRKILLLLMLTPLQVTYAQDTDTIAVTYKKPLFDYDYSKSLFKLTEEQQANKNGFLRYIAFTGYREGLEPVKRQFNFNIMTYDDQEHGSVLVKVYNSSIEEMIRRGIGEANMTSLDVKDPSKYRYDPAYGSSLEWLRKNAWCIEMFTPFPIDFDLFDASIAYQFGIRFGEETRKIKCLVLIRTSDIDKIKSTGVGDEVKGEKGIFKNTDLGLSMRTQLNAAWMLPMIDKTGYSNKVDLVLDIVSYHDLTALRKALQRYDLDLKEEVVEFPQIRYIKEVR